MAHRREGISCCKLAKKAELERVGFTGLRFGRVAPRNMHGLGSWADGSGRGGRVMARATAGGIRGIFGTTTVAVTVTRHLHE